MGSRSMRIYMHSYDCATKHSSKRPCTKNGYLTLWSLLPLCMVQPYGPKASPCTLAMRIELVAQPPVVVETLI